jgi:hypothetical protein
MKKFNLKAFAFKMKYGEDMENTLFQKKTPEPVQQTQIPLIVDDATEEKAKVFETLSVEQQRLVVYNVFKRLGNASDNEVRRYMRQNYGTETPSSTISARRNELRDRGMIEPLIDPETGLKLKRVDKITNEKNTIWRAK